MSSSDVSTKLSGDSVSEFFTTSFDEIGKCTTFNLKMILMITILCIAFGITLGLIQSLFSFEIVRVESKEKFSNDSFMSYTSAAKSEYQSIPLLPKNESYFRTFFGQANRYINTNEYRLEIFANLPVLNGNIYDVSKDHSHSYQLYLSNDSNEKYPLGELKKDGDGLYKFDKKMENIKELLKYRNIIISYRLNDKEEVLINGRFQ